MEALHKAFFYFKIAYGGVFFPFFWTQLRRFCFEIYAISGRVLRQGIIQEVNGVLNSE